MAPTQLQLQVTVQRLNLQVEGLSRDLSLLRAAIRDHLEGPTPDGRARLMYLLGKGEAPS